MFEYRGNKIAAQNDDEEKRTEVTRDDYGSFTELSSEEIEAVVCHSTVLLRWR